MGYDFTGGRIFDFPIDFSMGLTTVQRYCAACDYYYTSQGVVYAIIAVCLSVVLYVSRTSEKVTSRFPISLKLWVVNEPTSRKN